MTTNLITQLFKYDGYLNIIPDKRKLKQEINENINKYKELTLDEIYPNNDWIQMPLNAGHNKLIDFTDYVYSPGCFNLQEYRDTLFLISYKCIKTKSIGYTWQYNFKNILHPFHVVKHNFEIVDVDSHGVNYRCKNCNVDGFKLKGAKSGNIIIRNQNMVYSCNEIIIKNIIE